jgi:hypothetical protein
MVPLVGSNPRKGSTRPHGESRQPNHSVVGRTMKTLQERFDEKWIPVPESGCWIWVGSSFQQRHYENSPYGQIWIDGKLIKAHRASWEIYQGPIPAGLFVLHKCDTPACVNPSHLYIGTQANNVQDRDDKSRRGPPRGEKHPMSKLTDRDVILIRQCAGKGMTTTALAYLFGVHRTTIQRAKSGRRWSHV